MFKMSTLHALNFISLCLMRDVFITVALKIKIEKYKSVPLKNTDKIIRKADFFMLFFKTSMIIYYRLAIYKLFLK